MLLLNLNWNCPFGADGSLFRIPSHESFSKIIRKSALGKLRFVWLSVNVSLLLVVKYGGINSASLYNHFSGHFPIPFRLCSQPRGGVRDPYPSKVTVYRICEYSAINIKLLLTTSGFLFLLFCFLFGSPNMWALLKPSFFPPSWSTSHSVQSNK